MTEGSGALVVPKPSRVWDPALRPYLVAGKMAYLNASSLEEDASLLFRHKRYARSVALAVTGLEELGKATSLWFLGLGYVLPSHKDKLLKAIQHQHPMKQSVAYALALVGAVVPLARKVKVPSPRRRPQSWEELAHWVRQYTPLISSQAERMLEPLMKNFSRVEVTLERVAAGDLEKRRRRALYVDLAQAEVLNPASTRRSDAMLVRRDLRFSLRALKVIVEVAEWDEAGINAMLWSAEVNRSLWQTAQRSPSSVEDGPLRSSGRQEQMPNGT